MNDDVIREEDLHNVLCNEEKYQKIIYQMILRFYNHKFDTRMAYLEQFKYKCKTEQQK